MNDFNQTLVELKKTNSDLIDAEYRLSNTSDKKDHYHWEGIVNSLRQKRNNLAQRVLNNLLSNGTYLATTRSQDDALVQKISQKLPNVVSVINAGRLLDDVMSIWSEMSNTNGIWLLNSETLRSLNKYLVNDSPVWRVYTPYLNNNLALHGAFDSQEVATEHMIKVIQQSFNCLRAAVLQCQLDLQVDIMRKLEQLNSVPEELQQPIFLLVNNRINILVSPNQKNLDDYLNADAEQDVNNGEERSNKNNKNNKRKI